jgi:hypothetical protein
MVQREQMLEDFKSLLVIQTRVEDALAETARAYGYPVESVRCAAEARFGDLEQFGWKVSSCGDAED